MISGDPPTGPESPIGRGWAGLPESQRAIFDELLAVIEVELGVQIAIGRLGAIDPAAEDIQIVAGLIADEVFWAFLVEPRPPRETG